MKVILKKFAADKISKSDAVSYLNQNKKASVDGIKMQLVGIYEDSKGKICGIYEGDGGQGNILASRMIYKAGDLTRSSWNTDFPYMENYAGAEDPREESLKELLGNKYKKIQ